MSQFDSLIIGEVALVSLKMETPGPYMGTQEDLDAYIRAFY